MQHANRAFQLVLVRVIMTAVILFLSLLFAAGIFGVDFIRLKHPSYVNVRVSANPVYILYRKSLAAEVPGTNNVERSTFDTRCQRQCLLWQPAGTCKVAQTYWSRSELWCDLFNITICSPCQLAILTSSSPRADAKIWEFNYAPTDPEAGKSCAEYANGTFKGSCAAGCGKVGYYGSKCMLQSSCMACYHVGGYESVPPFKYQCSIGPCFTNGVLRTGLCYGSFTRWWRVGSGSGAWLTGLLLSYTDFLADLDNQMALAQRIFSKSKYRICIYSSSVEATYSGFFIGSNGSLSLAAFETGTFPNALRLPIVNAPLLKPLNLTCGPMWPVETNVFYNKTHIDSCSMNHTLLGNVNKWAGQTMISLQVFVEVEVFEC